MKTDARVRYTRKMIQQAFLTLLEKKSVNKITVTEICEMAEINRATFYKHYLDPYDLMEQMEQECLRGFREELTSISAEGIDQFLIWLLEAIQKNTGRYMTLASENGDEKFYIKIAEECFRFIYSNMEMREDENYSEEQLRMCFSFIMSGSSGIIEYWMRSGMIETPEKVVEVILEMNDKIIRRG